MDVKKLRDVVLKEINSLESKLINNNGKILSFDIKSTFGKSNIRIEYTYKNNIDTFTYIQGFDLS